VYSQPVHTGENCAKKCLTNVLLLEMGCYMWDYGTHKPMPVDAMHLQVEQGLRWLEAGRIQGIIFLASCICDLNLEAVEWTRRWIQTVGDHRLQLASSQ